MSTQNKCDDGRRRFLRDIAATAPAAVAAAAALSVGNVQAEEVTARDEKPKHKGYELTQHIADYYKSASV